MRWKSWTGGAAARDQLDDGASTAYQEATVSTEYGEQMDRVRAQLRELVAPQAHRESRMVQRQRRAAGEARVIVRFDLALSTAFGEPAELAVTYEPDPVGEPVLVVTFGPVELSGAGAELLPLVAALRATVAPLSDDNGEVGDSDPWRISPNLLGGEDGRAEKSCEPDEAGA